MSSSGDDALEMPCLGRPFQLGTLYDCRSDRLIMGMALWDDEVIQKATSTKPQTASDFKVIAEDSISEKTTNMDISASLKLSLLGGLVQVEGSAKYLDDRKSSKRQARVSLKYWSTTRVEHLTMEGLSKFQHTRIFDDKIATHVVTGVLYGAEAFFVFDRQVSESESFRDIHGRVEAMVKALPCIDLSIGGSAEVGIKQGEKEDTSKFVCTFYGDFVLKSNPSTFEEAVKVYKELPELLGVDSGENTVPKKVWLYPLSKLDRKAAQITREISSSLVSQAQSILEDMHEVEMRSNDLMKYEVYFNFQGIREQLSSFKEMVVEYKTDFVKCLTALLPRIRGGGTEETELAMLYKAMHASPFSHLRLTSWLDGKTPEVKVLQEYLESMQRSGSAIQFAFSSGSLYPLIHSIDHRYILCFAFKIAGKNNAYLNKMHAYLRQQQTSEDFENATPSMWLENDDLTSDMMLQARQFRSFAQANSGKADLKCVVTDRSERDTSSNKGAVIVLYKGGKQRAFEPPGQPGKPKESGVTHDSIELVWDKPEYGAQNVEFYTVSYTYTPIATDPIDQWKTQKTEGVQETVIVSGLAPKVAYSFKVRSECSAGVSVYSEVSDPIETKPRTAENTLAKRMKEKCGPPIEDGPPAVYQLPVQEMMRDGTKQIAKFHIGSKPGHSSSPEKVLMVLGATGAGKSTLINGMANYILGVEWDDDFRFKLIMDEASTTETHTQSSWITAYTFHKMEGSPVPYTLTIIHTPGFGDTRGLKRDKQIKSQIKEFFSIPDKDGGIDHLDGIGFVTQASLARLTPTQRYIFDSILAMFGKDLASNIFMMFTFTDVMKPPVLDAIKKAQIPFQKSFKFNNSALFMYGHDDDEGDADFAQMFWKMSLKSFKKFFDSLAEAKPNSMRLTKEVLRECERLEAIIQDLQNGVLQIDQLQVSDMRQYTGRLLQIMVEVLEMVQTIKQSLQRLDEIALKPNPLTEVGYIELLSQSEKDQAKPGWKRRVWFYKKVKQHAVELKSVASGEDITRMLQGQPALTFMEKVMGPFLL